MIQELRHTWPAQQIAKVAYRNAGKWHARGYDTDQTIILAGVPRSGSTWFQEMLHRITGFPVVHEPLHLTKIPHLIESYNLDTRTWRTYRKPDVEDEKFNELLRGILSGSALQGNFIKWGFTPFRGLLRHKPLIVKFCRSSLFLPYLCTHFPKNKVILIVRSPFSVVSSQLLHGSWDGVSLSRFQEEFHQDNPDLEFPEGISHPEEVLATNWCIEHAYLRKNSDRLEETIVVKYEEMYQDPERHLRKMLKYLGFAWEEEYLDVARIKSRTVREGSALLEDGDPTVGYRKQLTKDQIRRIDAVVEHFGRPFYETDERSTGPDPKSGLAGTYSALRYQK